MVRDVCLQIQGSDPQEYLGQESIAITQGAESTNKRMKSDQLHTKMKTNVSFIGGFLYPQRLYMSKAHHIPQSRFRLEETII